MVKKTDLNSFSEIRENLSYWLSKKPEERVAAVELLRRQHDGDTTILRRVACVIQR
jgi:hypothetical protein